MDRLGEVSAGVFVGTGDLYTTNSTVVAKICRTFLRRS